MQNRKAVALFKKKKWSSAGRSGVQVVDFEWSVSASRQSEDVKSLLFKFHVK